jgi:Stealth protein CR1, conserved region 1
VLSKVSSRLGRLLPSLANAIGARYAIDAVIAWVDGRDRKHRAKRKRYLADPGGDAKPERAAGYPTDY